MTAETPQEAPVTLGEAGERLWCSVTGEYDLEEHEAALLAQACRITDLLDELDRIVGEEGAVVDSPQGRKAHPAVVEARQQSIALARLLSALRLPAGEDDAGTRRPQRRSGVRGIYAVGNGS